MRLEHGGKGEAVHFCFYADFLFHEKGLGLGFEITKRKYA
jgi:hypothetical protein